MYDTYNEYVLLHHKDAHLLHEVDLMANAKKR